ncbi:CDP-alcohol phosphatidyltransferase family protein [Patescibacteria group bacterium]|nr:CDP-alcohol phosphatidyltransferase family protein [Patescibacteria group bacterium]
MNNHSSPYQNDHDDAITAGEKYIRDTLMSPVARAIWLLWPVPRLLRRFGISADNTILFGAANAVSILGLLLLGKFWFMYHASGLTKTAFLILISAFITDFIDGPIARIHDEITPLGTFLDHVRDYLAFFSVLAIVFFSYQYKPDLEVLLSLTALTTVILIIANIKMLLARHEIFKNHRDLLSIIRDSSLEDYQTSFTGRFHFFTAAIGISGLLLFTLVRREWIYFVSYSTLLVHITVSGFYIHEVWNNYYKRLAVFERWRRRSQNIKAKIQSLRQKNTAL